jgi:hypothetical protein
MIGKISQIIFEQTEPRMLDRYRFNRLTAKANNSEDKIFIAFGKLVEFLRENPNNDTQAKVIAVYDSISHISDEFFRKILISIRDDLGSGNFFALMTNISSAIPGRFPPAVFSTFSRICIQAAILQRNNHIHSI